VALRHRLAAALRTVEVVRIALAGVSGVLLALLAGHVFDQFVPGLLVAPILVTLALVATSVAASMRSTDGTPSWAVRVLVAVIAVLTSTVAAAIWTGGSISDGTVGLRFGPRRLLTTEWPSPSDPVIVATLAALVGLATAIAALLASSRRWRLLPTLPPLLVVVVLIALGAPERAPWWLFVSFGAVAVADALTAGHGSAGARWTFDTTILVSFAVVGVATVGSASALGWTHRADPRSTTEAEVSAILLDPIEATVAMRGAEPSERIATIADRSPLARPTMPDRWRLAAFSTYDGQRWTPQLELRPIGGRLAATPDGADADVLVYEVRYDGDDIDLLPVPGEILTIDRSVETDANRVAVRLIDRPSADTIVLASSLPAPTAQHALDVGLAVVEPDDVSAGFVDWARDLADSGRLIDQINTLASAMRDEWELDSGAPGGGQQLALIERFVTVTQHGTREQFVTAYVLMARSLGADARVAVGFQVPVDELGSTFDLTTAQAAVWPEVRLADGTWLAIDPVPARQSDEDQQEAVPPDAQTPAAAQPPLETPPDEPRDDDEVVEQPDTANRWSEIRVWLVRGGAVGGSVLGPILLVVGLILLVKWRRRQRRLRASDPVVRVRGIWANTTDALVDAGLTIAPSWTDDTIAERSGAVMVAAPHEARRLAAMASAVTFGSPSRDAAGQLAADASTTASSIEDAIRASRTRWQRMRWRLSLRSLRRSTRSPVTP